MSFGKMIQYMARVMLGVLCVLVVGGTAATVWLIYQPVHVDELVQDRYFALLEADPARETLYTRAYTGYVKLTESNALHYFVHEIAARVALAMGNTRAAAVQEYRAAYHRPDN